jgi:hypothetical protein
MTRITKAHVYSSSDQTILALDGKEICNVSKVGGAVGRLKF